MARIFAAEAGERERDARHPRRCYGCRDPGGFAMSTSDDMLLPPPPSAEQIRRREFATVRRGYDPEQVRTYLSSVADQIELMERELNQVRLELSSAASRGELITDQATASPPAPPAQDPYEALSKRFAGLIETADQEAEKMLENARAEAKRALDQARSEADRIRVGAQAHAEEGRQEVADLLERATTEADRVLSALGERRRSLASQLEGMRAKLIAMAEDLSIPIEEPAAADTYVADAPEVGDEDAEPPPDARQADARQADARQADARQADARQERVPLQRQGPLEIPDLEPLDVGLEERHD
jgi:DivIVA domain-containing protein